MVALEDENVWMYEQPLHGQGCECVCEHACVCEYGCAHECESGYDCVWVGDGSSLSRQVIQWTAGVE